MNEIPSRPRPRKPADEAERLRALRELTSLSSARDSEFDMIVELTAIACEAPLALISFMDAERGWTKAAFGISPTEATRDDSFCAHTILSRELLEVPDTTSDFRFAENPFVTGEPFVRFYAGMPLVTSDGHAIGSLCVGDRISRVLTARQRVALEKFAAYIVSVLELRRREDSLPRARADRGRVLVAEDNLVNQKVTQRLLEKLGFRADVVSNGLQVIDALHRVHYDLVLMDCQMPDMDGYTATRVIRARDARRLPIIALTGSDLPEDRERCLQSGMDDMLPKPVREQDLDRAMKKWLPLVEELVLAAV
jgi:CheY-like chemotaxis protein